MTTKSDSQSPTFLRVVLSILSLLFFPIVSARYFFSCIKQKDVVAAAGFLFSSIVGTITLAAIIEGYWYQRAHSVNELWLITLSVTVALYMLIGYGVLRLVSEQYSKTKYTKEYSDEWSSAPKYLTDFETRG